MTSNGPYPLPGFTEWTVEMTHSCGTESFSFTTGEGLGPVEPTELVGNVWAIQPNGYAYPVWSVLNLFGSLNFGFLAIDGSDGESIDVLFAVPDASGAQDFCVPTGEIRGLDFSANPQFRAAPFDYPVSYLDPAGQPVSFPHQQGSIEATIFDGQLLGVTMSGFVETTEVAVAAGAPPNSVCNMWGCVACPDGSGQTCFEETNAASYGNMVPSAETIVPRTAEEIAVDSGLSVARLGSRLARTPGRRATPIASRREGRTGPVTPTIGDPHVAMDDWTAAGCRLRGRRRRHLAEGRGNAAR